MYWHEYILDFETVTKLEESMEGGLISKTNKTLCDFLKPYDQ